MSENIKPFRYRCDVPMAKKKGILKYCDKKCRYCLCGIVMDERGYEFHVPDSLHGCTNFVLRNYAKGKWVGYDRATGEELNNDD